MKSTIAQVLLFCKRYVYHFPLIHLLILKVNLCTSRRTQLQQKLEMSVSFVIRSWFCLFVLMFCIAANILQPWRDVSCPPRLYNTIQLFYCFISFHMRHSQNTFINMFNINTKNDISFSIMLNKRSIWKKKISILLCRTGCICWMQKFCYFFNCRTTGIQKVDKLIFII